MPGRICLTPPYDAPAGFSETYHAALERQAAVGMQTIAPSGGSFVGPPIFIWPTLANDADPPLEW
jgi:hypothetical protein